MNITELLRAMIERLRTVSPSHFNQNELGVGIMRGSLFSLGPCGCVFHHTFDLIPNIPGMCPADGAHNICTGAITRMGLSADHADFIFGHVFYIETAAIQMGIERWEYEKHTPGAAIKRIEIVLKQIGDSK